MSKWDGRKRALLLTMFFLVWVIVIVASLVRIQLVNYNLFSERVQAQSKREVILHPKRGTIYDRNGLVLAASTKTKSAFISNKDATASIDALRALGQALHLPPRQITAVKKRIANQDKFIWVKRKLSEIELNRVEKAMSGGNHDGVINFIEEYKRVYPQKRIAAHILGGVGIDEQGLAGIEFAHDNHVRGKGGKVQIFLDARRKAFQLNYLAEPQPGRDVYLTIDATLQYIIERELERAVKSSKARGGSVIVIDVDDGAVLAMASNPTFSPEEISRVQPRQLINRATSFNYDPGSTFKVILAAAALEGNVSYPQQIFNCGNGSMQIRNRVISDVKPFGQLSFEEILIHSSNIGAVRIGMLVGGKRYFQTILDFGFGRRSGIELPGEERGILNPMEKWSDVSLAFLSFGYEISVTPLQMAVAFNTIAAGGIRHRPYILLEPGQLKEDGERILSQATSRRLANIMAEVVRRGTGKRASMVGLEVAGKTGTAKKVKKGRYSNDYIASFGGFFPLDRPRVTIFVNIDEPLVNHFGGEIAAPLFKAIAEKLSFYLKVFPERAGELEVRL